MYKREPFYFVSHIVLGFISYYYREILYLTLGYQLIQYFTNTRFFILEMELKDGNSVSHTAVKLGEVALGYFIAHLYETNFQWKD